jgi:hypothetical protein
MVNFPDIYLSQILNYLVGLGAWLVVVDDFRRAAAQRNCGSHQLQQTLLTFL